MYIFVTSPGRSGTKFISEVFKCCTNLLSIHGGEEKFKDIIDTGSYRNNDNIDIIINRINLLKNNNADIIDTSQIFIHRLVENIITMNDMKPLYVINLIRNPLEVAISLENRNSYPSNNNCLWRLPLISKDRIIKIDKHLTVFQENLFDWIDTQMKFDKYNKYFDKYYIFNFENLNNIDELIKMFKHFNVVFDIYNLKNALLNNTLFKHNNKIPTKITERHISETKEFLNYLKTLDNYPNEIINKYFQNIN